MPDESYVPRRTLVAHDCDHAYQPFPHGEGSTRATSHTRARVTVRVLTRRGARVVYLAGGVTAHIPEFLHDGRFAPVSSSERCRSAKRRRSGARSYKPMAA